jgi:hypothetical protein
VTGEVAAGTFKDGACYAFRSSGAPRFLCAPAPRDAWKSPRARDGCTAHSRSAFPIGSALACPMHAPGLCQCPLDRRAAATPAGHCRDRPARSSCDRMWPPAGDSAGRTLTTVVLISCYTLLGSHPWGHCHLGMGIIFFSKRARLPSGSRSRASASFLDSIQILECEQPGLHRLLYGTQCDEFTRK